jgi:hypothetical protein
MGILLKDAWKLAKKEEKSKPATPVPASNEASTWNTLKLPVGKQVYNSEELNNYITKLQKSKLTHIRVPIDTNLKTFGMGINYSASLIITNGTEYASVIVFQKLYFVSYSVLVGRGLLSQYPPSQIEKMSVVEIKERSTKDHKRTYNIIVGR